jgi:hypothetical protein
MVTNLTSSSRSAIADLTIELWTSRCLALVRVLIDESIVRRCPDASLSRR